MTTQQAEFVKVDRENANEVYVQIINLDGTIADEGVYRSTGAAERHAEKLAKRLGCEWGGNY